MNSATKYEKLPTSFLETESGMEVVGSWRRSSRELVFHGDRLPGGEDEKVWEVMVIGDHHW